MDRDESTEVFRQADVIAKPTLATRRVLFISGIYPADLHTAVYGIYQRMRIFLTALSGISDELDVLFYINYDNQISPQAVREAEHNLFENWGIRATVFFSHRGETGTSANWWRHYIIPAFSIYQQEGYADLSQVSQSNALGRCLDRQPDALFVMGLQTMCPVLLAKRPLPPIFFDLNDIEHIKFYRNLRRPPLWPAKLLYYLHLPAIIAHERRSIKAAKKTFVCSILDRNYLTRQWRLPGVACIPNSVTLPPADKEAAETKTLLFIGSYSYAPNIDAAEFLIKEIWPLVRRSVPSANLIIAGNKPERIPSYHNRISGVIFTGFVDDLAELYQQAQVVCCPILSGGGTRVKIIEGAAYGKAIVSTGVGAEGLELRDDQEIILRDDATSFAQVCIDLLENPTRCRMIGQAARKQVSLLYDRDRILETIKAEITSGAHAIKKHKMAD